jgi:hypothetical protein
LPRFIVRIIRVIWVSWEEGGGEVAKLEDACKDKENGEEEKQKEVGAM